MRAFLFGLLLASSLGAADIQFSWDANPDVVSGYRLSWGTESGSYSNSITTTNTTVVVSNLPIGKTYLSVVAVNSEGVESDYSDEIVFSNEATNRFIVILGTGSLTQGSAITEILKAKSFEVMSKIEGAWFVMGEDITSRALAEELTRSPLVGAKVKLIIKIHSDGKMTYWGNASKDVWSWMALHWGKSG